MRGTARAADEKLENVLRPIGVAEPAPGLEFDDKVDLGQSLSSVSTLIADSIEGWDSVTGAVLELWFAAASGIAAPVISLTVFSHPLNAHQQAVPDGSYRIACSQ